MTDWTRSEKTTRTVEYIVPTNGPWGAAWNQVQQALSAAVDEWETLNGRTVYDDVLRVHVRDDEIVISFRKTGD